TRGVGPADSTGKSVVKYCPGGSFAFSALCRPEKPRETMAIHNSPFARSSCSANNKETFPALHRLHRLAIANAKWWPNETDRREPFNVRGLRGSHLGS